MFLIYSKKRTEVQCDQKIEKKNRQVFGKSSQKSSQNQTIKNHM
jgi:hypothetical protein